MPERFTDLAIDYAYDWTDCPPLFIKWAALSAVSTVMGPKVYFDRGDRPLTPNIWVSLIGRSSQRKSTAVNFAKGLVTSVTPNVCGVGDYTYEKHLEDLGLQPHMGLYYDEMAILMDLYQRKYNIGMMATHTSLFEENEFHRSTKTYQVHIKNAYLTILTASTPEWISKSIDSKGNVISSGYFPRYSWARAPEPTPSDRRLEFQPPADMAKKKIILKRLKEIAHYKGPVRYTPDAEQEYKQWYKEISIRQNSLDYLCQPFVSKILSPHSHRLAMIFAADMGTFPVVTVDVFREVSRELNSMVANLPSLVLDDMTVNDQQRDRKRIMELLAQRLHMTRSELSQQTRILGKDLIARLQDLEMSGMIEVIPEKTKTKPRLIVSLPGRYKAAEGQESNEKDWSFGDETGAG